MDHSEDFAVGGTAVVGLYHGCLTLAIACVQRRVNVLRGDIDSVGAGQMHCCVSCSSNGHAGLALHEAGLQH